MRAPDTSLAQILISGLRYRMETSREHMYYSYMYIGNQISISLNDIHGNGTRDWQRSIWSQTSFRDLLVSVDQSISWFSVLANIRIRKFELHVRDQSILILALFILKFAFGWISIQLTSGPTDDWTLELTSHIKTADDEIQYISPHSYIEQTASEFQWRQQYCASVL